ncbi:MAG: leucine--tRNA ligase [Nanoarchaeota archaeon]
MAKPKIDFKKTESKWQKAWEDEKVFEVSEKSKKPKYYILEMFPYPSGSGLHMGHAWNYIIGDIHSRSKIMQGFNVLHPMGFDALGLPAENAAISVGEHPEDYTKKSIKNYIKQQKNLGLSYDWSRVVNTADPEYYKWDQWIFLKMLKKGLAYQKTSSVNFCEKCNTVLANEQVVNGKCWRHDNTNVQIKKIKQWFLKTTDYADELLEDHKKLNWPHKTIAMQKNWIGKSHGTEIDFVVENPDNKKEKTKFPIFTTRPDTLFGVTFMVVSAQHDKLFDLVTKKQKKEVEKFLEKIKSVSEKPGESGELEKEGVFTGSYAINPATNEKVPIYAGNFVVAEYGSGMVMAVPAHDQRDFEFAKKYNIPIKIVIQPEDYEINPEKMSRAFTGEGRLINSEQFNNWDNQEAIDEITNWLSKNKKARKTINYKLRDWGISRQRYWGTPIPIIYCEKCGTVPVQEKDLPVKLPKKVDFGKGNPLETNENWIKTKCPECGQTARRETETMDTFVNSSWYFLRYCDPKNNKEIFDKKKADYWMPIDLYIGGAEHACMHLIYCRFYTKFLSDLGLINFREPAPRLFHQGMLRGEGGVKMSKSKPETCVLPETVSDKYGIDTARFFLSSLASPDKDIDWSDKEIQGSLKFINKIIETYENIKIGKDSLEIEIKLNKTIRNVTKYLEEIYEYRKATIEIRELFDLISEQEQVSKNTLESALKLISPFCPHLAEELWEKIGNNKSGKNFISLSEWPKVDENKLKNKKQDSKKDINQKLIQTLKPIVEKYSNKEKINIYTIPPEKDKFDKNLLEKELGKKVEIYSSADSEVKSGEVDPENKAKKARPSQPAFYLE